MKRVKNSIKKIADNVLAMYAILTLIIIGLIIYIFIDNGGNTSKTIYKQIKVNNDLGDSVACKSNVIRDDVTNIVIKFCGDGEVTILDSSNTSTTTETDASVTASDTTTTNEDGTVTTEGDTSVTDTSVPESSTCTKVTTNEEKLDVSNVANFYSSYNYANNTYIYYILTEDGKVYETTQTNIISKNYEVTAVDDMEDIIGIDEYITFQTNTNIYTSDLYAIDKKGELHLLRNIY